MRRLSGDGGELGASRREEEGSPQGWGVVGGGRWRRRYAELVSVVPEGGFEMSGANTRLHTSE